MMKWKMSKRWRKRIKDENEEGDGMDGGGGRI